MNRLNAQNKHIKKILSVVLKNRKDNQYYVEPFMENYNFISSVEGNRIGNDIDGNKIKMWKSIQKGWLPPKYLTEMDYNYIIDNRKNISPQLVAYFDMNVLPALSNGRKNTISKIESYTRRVFNDILKNVEKLKEIKFTHSNYLELDVPSNSIIFCNIPNTDDFDYDIFWSWCRVKTTNGHRVYVMNSTAPDDFKVVWNHNRNATKIFIHKELKLF